MAKSTEGIRSGIETFTPDEAQAILDTKNKHNRKMRKSAIETYASAMKAGEWMVNGEAIIFDRNDNLIQGQHRMAACVLAGKPFTTLVVRGVDSKAFDTLDQGVPRKLKDILHISSEDLSAELAVALRVLWLQLTRRKQAGSPAFRAHQAIILLRAHPNLREAIGTIKVLNQEGGAKVFSVGMEAAILYMLDHYFEAPAGLGKCFMEALKGLPVTDEEFVERMAGVNKLAARCRATEGKRLNRDEQMALTWKVVGMVMDKTPIPRTLKVDPDDSPLLFGTPEDVPADALPRAMRSDIQEDAAETPDGDDDAS